ncbi:MAG TPA: orotidine-5'-phosphate decarboxylase [Planctomycetota bacterium]|jgi:orotidine-5'-phosphate decarboxylase|nr:orotidine-5'-phosphate decarboxylase [Planctomycetota bacterium]
MSSNFADRLDEAIARAGNPCLVGLDPHVDLLPEEFAAARSGATRKERANAVAEFLCEIIDLVAGRIPAVKPQSALFELHGADGAAAWERVVRRARAAGLLVIGDVKRGDIDSTARAYARAFLEGDPADPESRCDAITVNPYLGKDSVTPFLEACARTGGGIYVLVRTSNPGGAMFQGHGSPPLYERVADAVVEWGRDLVGKRGLSSVGAVVGATHPTELASLRARMPGVPFLIPGYGAQGAGAGEVAGGFLADGRGAVVNSSRAILFAWREPRFRGVHWKDASRTALDEMIAALSAVSASSRA